MKSIEKILNESLDDLLKEVVAEADLGESEFTYKIAQAALDGKKTVKIGDKEHPVKMSKDKAQAIVGKKEAAMLEDHDPQYKAGAGKRKKQLDQTQADLKKAKKLRKQGKTAQAKKIEQTAYNRRLRMEKEARKKGKMSKQKSKYTESVLDSALDDLLTEIAIEEAKKKKKKKGSRKITSAQDTALKNKAKKSRAPLGALKAVYRKGLGAYYSSGSRPGMSPQQWAMARVNSFLKGGKARKVDAAQWKQVSKFRKKKRKK